jgi:hypothetical protein
MLGSGPDWEKNLKEIGEKRILTRILTGILEG